MIVVVGMVVAWEKLMGDPSGRPARVTRVATAVTRVRDGATVGETGPTGLLIERAATTSPHAGDEDARPTSPRRWAACEPGRLRVVPFIGNDVMMPGHASDTQWLPGALVEQGADGTLCAGPLPSSSARPTAWTSDMERPLRMTMMASSTSSPEMVRNPCCARGRQLTLDQPEALTRGGGRQTESVIVTQRSRASGMPARLGTRGNAAMRGRLSGTSGSPSESLQQMPRRGAPS